MTRRPLIQLIFALTGTVGCGTPVFHPMVLPAKVAPQQLVAATPLKVHLPSGDLFVLTVWQEEGDSMLVGNGSRYNPRRELLSSGAARIPIDSIALLEMSSRDMARPIGLTLLPVWTTVVGIVTVACVIDPKSCFGSCPTFYSDETATRPLAEGFSASVARSMEARDVDELPGVRVHEGMVHLVMRNEALETHAVRSLELLLLPRAGGEVFAAPDGRFFRGSSVAAPTDCRAREGSCLAAVRERGGLEYRSYTDSTDLGTMETVELSFPVERGATAGLVLGARQSFVSTYLLYQTMAYAGSRAVDWLLALERGGTGGFGAGFETMYLIGTIGVELQIAGEWTPVGRFGEPGPLATDVQVIPLPAGAAGEAVQVRLTMARGAWRFDYAGLSRLGSEVHPVSVLPRRVLRKGTPDAPALERLLDPARHLVTYPGDRYLIEWQLPQGLDDAAFFLASTGYYYEWMRPEWVREENPGMMMMLATNPREALRRMAPGFKALEPRIDSLFWSSRFEGGK
jgi:hypothetical protein